MEATFKIQIICNIKSNKRWLFIITAYYCQMSDVKLYSKSEETLCLDRDFNAIKIRTLLS